MMKWFKRESRPPARSSSYEETATTRLLEQYNKFWFITCSPDFWIRNVNFSDSFVKVYRPTIILNHMVMVVFCTSCTLSLWTQHDLTPSQQSDQLAYGLSTPIITVFYHFVMLYYTDDVRELMYQLAIVLKASHNDEKAEKEMIGQSKLYNTIFFSSCVCNILLVGMYNTYKVLTSDATFITCISAWPDLSDTSTLAGLTRVLVYFLWFFHVVRNMGVFLIIHTVLLFLGQQYKNLQSYFEGLNEIFEDNSLSQDKKDVKYEKMFRHGIQQHALTLWCVNESQRVFKITFSLHVLLWCGLLISILPDVMNDDTHSITVLAQNAPRFSAALVGLGYFMWPAGDITVEASILPQAMYGSGWQCCCQGSSRIRKLIVLAMMQAQRPIEIKAFGQFTFSYETYVSIVKMSHSLFSVLY